jgi:hypothetical protein
MTAYQFKRDLFDDVLCQVIGNEKNIATFAT